MISESDNTATDHVLHLLGRERAEALVKNLGHAQPERMQPFLYTLEMFKLKTNPEILRRFSEADTPARRELLNKEVRALPRPSKNWSEPVAIDSVEWFASASDLCRLMAHFRAKGDKTALDILSINPGVKAPEGGYAYVGYKGGSEPGVSNATWLLETAKGSHYCLSLGWNDPSSSEEPPELDTLAQALIDAIPALP
jgi:beta-lactamase class A